MSQFKLEDADVLIDLANQTLTLPKHNKFYVISTGKNGIGEQENTGRTPRGWHRVAKKLVHKLLKMRFLLHVSQQGRSIAVN